MSDLALPASTLEFRIRRLGIDKFRYRGGSPDEGQVMSTLKYELYGTARCPYTQEMRDWLELRTLDFVEYDVESDPAALERMKAVTGGQRSVPVLVEDGRVTQIGWQGRSCIVG